MSKTLYERLGGNDGIRKLVDDAVDAHLNNSIVKTRFEITEDIEYAKRMSVEFFCAGSGGPETYTGRDMATTHKGMNISEQEFIAVVDDIFMAMDKNDLGDDVIKDVLAALYLFAQKRDYPRINILKMGMPNKMLNTVRYRSLGRSAALLLRAG